LRRFSLRPVGWSRLLLIHIPSAAVFASVQLGIYTFIAAGLAMASGSEGRSLIEFYEWLFVREFQSSFLVYLAIISSVTAYDRIFMSDQDAKEDIRGYTLEHVGNGNGNGNGKDYVK